MEKQILVTGVTGQQGGAVARTLTAKGFKVTGLSRRAEGEKENALKKDGIEIVIGDYKDDVSLVQAMQGFKLVFAYTTPFEDGDDAETNQGKTLVDAAKEAGVEHFIYNSVASADQKTGIPHFDSKYKVEEYVRASGLDWTIVAPAYFMDNLLFPQTIDGLKNGVYAQGVPGSTEIQQVSVQNIADFVTHVAENLETFKSKRINIAGDTVSGDQTAEILSEVLDKDIQFQEIPREQIASFSEDFALMNDWFTSTGYDVDVEQLKTDYPDIHWQTFREWLDQHTDKLQ